MVGKIQGEWKKIQGGRKKYFSNVLRSLAFAKLLRSRKTFAFPRETLRSLAKIFAFPPPKLKKKKYLREKAKVLRGNANIFARERKSFARERKVSRGNAKVLRENAKHLKNIFSSHPEFFPLTLIFSHHNVL